MTTEFYNNSAVRRQDRLLDAERAEELLREAEFGVLSMTDENGEAYGVPLNFVWDEAGFVCGNDEGSIGAIYIHCAPEGKKLRAISRNAVVSFCIVGNVKPQPENLTTLYESVIIKGKARIGLGEEEKKNALRLLVKKFAPDQAEHGEKSCQREQSETIFNYAECSRFRDKVERSIEKSFHRTEIIRIDIERISGKSKRAKS